MTLLYKSTRGGEGLYRASEAIIKGIAEDGGLFVPCGLPKFGMALETLKDNTYADTAYEVMRLFLDDFEEEELRTCIRKAYDDKFDTKEIVPLASLGEGISVLELFHGPTLAFKDMALSILPRFMQVSKEKNHIKEDIVILTATSGDTGKAALEGFCDVEGVQIIVFFPEDGVSPVQKLQMVTQEGANTHVAGIRGNFDDAQTGVKNLFADKAFGESLQKKGYRLSSANSINIGRLIPQIVYYFAAYGQLLNRGVMTPGELVDFVVPTGNFGNILAGYYAKNMGLPVGRLVCASNENKVLTDFFGSGTYNRNRDLVKTQSPSMDILVSSNLERLLFEALGRREDLVASWMKDLGKGGTYDIKSGLSTLKEDFEAGCASDAEGRKAIAEVYNRYGYLMDTHTAVAYAVNEKRMDRKLSGHTVILSTASPYKFPKDVLSAIDRKFEEKDEMDLMEIMPAYMKGEAPDAVKGLRNREVLHRTVCMKEDMKEAVEAFLAGRACK